MRTKRIKPRTYDRRQTQRRKGLLVPEWRMAHKWVSVQLAAFIAAAQGLYTLVPTMKEYVPDAIWHPLMAALAIGVILARIYQQKG